MSLIRSIIHLARHETELYMKAYLKFWNILLKVYWMENKFRWKS